jgi:hypothetical protein
MDRGMVSEENLAFLRGRGGSYMVGTPKGMLRRFEHHLIDKDWHEVQEGVEVKLVPGPDGTETYILARSADRQKKEQAMHQRFYDRMEAGPRASGPSEGTQLAGGYGFRCSDANGQGDQRQGTAVDHVEPQRSLACMACVVGQMLSATDEPDRDRPGQAVEDVHSVDRGGMGVSDHQG